MNGFALPSRGYLTVTGDVSACHSLRAMLLASSGESSVMLLKSPHCLQQPLITKSDLLHSVRSTEFEKPYLGSKIF